MRLPRLSLFLCSLLALPAGAGRLGDLVLENATVVVGNGQVLSPATVVVRNGVIEAVGTKVAVPPGAERLDLRGMFVYPGLIDTLTTQGLRKQKEAGQPEPMLAEVKAADRLQPGDAPFSSWREAGILVLHVAPDRGVFRGQTALVDAGGAVLRSPLAMCTFLQGTGYRNRRRGITEPGGLFPTRFIGVFPFIREAILGARYDEKSWPALVPVARRAMPLVLPAEEEREVRRALELIEELQVEGIIAGGYEAAQLAPALKKLGIPVLVSLNFPQRPADVHPEFEEPLRVMRYRHHAPYSAAELARAGVRIAFCSNGLGRGADFLANLRLAVRAGLPEDAALRAATLTAAEILGVARELGSVEPGKAANLIVTDGRLFDPRSRIKQVLVAGKRYEVPATEQVSTLPTLAPLPPPAPAPQRADLFFKNANIMTVSHGTIRGGALLVRDGKIAAVGKDLTAPPGVQVIDAAGQWIIPGMIDCHTHLATDSHNEATSNVTSMTGILDTLNPTQIDIYQVLAVGITTSHVLHGSVNPIGGKNVIIKMRWGRTAPEMLFEGAPPGLKFAVKEFGRREGSSPPSSTMGVEAVWRQWLTEAREYGKKWDAYRARPVGLAPPRDLRLEPLVEVLRGRRQAHLHTFQMDEMLMAMRVAEDFGFKFAVLHHAGEAYMVAPEIARHGAGVTIFSETANASPYNAAMLLRKGLVTSIHSDGAGNARNFNVQAARLMKFGDLTEDEALALVTLNPAKQLGIDRRVGSIDVGKDADLVIFSQYPLSVYAVPEKVFIDGQLYFSREQDHQRWEKAELEKKRLAQFDKGGRQ